MENVPNEIIHLTVVIMLMCLGAGVKLFCVIEAKSSTEFNSQFTWFLALIIMVIALVNIMLRLIDKALPCL